MVCAWANSHQYTVRYQAGNWRFFTFKNPTCQQLQYGFLEPHIPVVSETLRRVFEEELKAYAASGFEIKKRIRYYFWQT